ncbi:MAG: adenylate/guanylate cyclase domain-containing protein [Alphaproteobacteria bacterium]
MNLQDRLHGHGRIAARLRDSFTRESRSGLRQATIVRTVALAATAVWLIDVIEYPQVLFYHAVLAVFALLGLGHDLSARRLAPAIWPSALFILADSCLMAYTLSTVNPLEVAPAPAQMTLRLGNFQFFYMLLVSSVLTYSPRLVAWCGVTGAAAWGAAVARVMYLPDTLTPARLYGWDAFEAAGRVPLMLLPNFVSTTMLFKEIFVFLVVTGILATVVWRVRQLALRQAGIERERANLSRHFSPNMVDALAQTDEPFGTVRQQDAAVLFVDIVGFTSLTERLEPRRTLDILRAFHACVAERIFEHDGTLDKYIGDGVMATFGVPVTSPDDAANAIACARDIARAIDQLNQSQASDSGVPIRVGTGVHYGPVVTGDIGDERRLEFAVIGDTVNVASRLEALTREIGCSIVISDDLVVAAGFDSGSAPDCFRGFQPASPRKIKGKSEPLKIWILKS